MPNYAKLHDLASCVKAQYPDLDDEWCTIDGLKSPIQANPDTKIQKKFYNSWMSLMYLFLQQMALFQSVVSTCQDQHMIVQQLTLDSYMTSLKKCINKLT